MCTWLRLWLGPDIGCGKYSELNTITQTCAWFWQTLRPKVGRSHWTNYLRGPVIKQQHRIFTLSFRLQIFSSSSYFDDWCIPDADGRSGPARFAQHEKLGPLKYKCSKVFAFKIHNLYESISWQDDEIPLISFLDQCEDSCWRAQGWHQSGHLQSRRIVTGPERLCWESLWVPGILLFFLK